MTSAYNDAIDRIAAFAKRRHCELASLPTIPHRDELDRALSGLLRNVPIGPEPLSETLDCLLGSIVPALAQGQAGPRYFGFVTGGTTDAAQLADFLTTLLDTNAAVNLPGASIATYVEDLALRYVLQMVGLPPDVYQGILTTGATSANILGLGCGRNTVIRRVRASEGESDWDVSLDGLGGVDVDVFCAGAHVSVLKAAGVLGIGRRNCHDLTKDGTPADFDRAKLETRLRENVERRRGSIVVASAGEVNTGAFTDLSGLSELCQMYGAWFHVDAAFGYLALLHPLFKHHLRGFSDADSITTDAHKQFNVPYDCGVFFTRSKRILLDLCASGPAAYLDDMHMTCHPIDEDETLMVARALSAKLPSPLNLGLENSRRCRALPLFASLTSLGVLGYSELVERQCGFAAAVAHMIRSDFAKELYLINSDQDMYIIVLFAPARTCTNPRYRGKEGSGNFTDDINATRKLYLTKTNWRGTPAIRLAVSNWATSMSDLTIVRQVFEKLLL
ncbi:uncharacterized protein L969DRAFT_101813 [Mixia osmundae IAM 14324]|uniref:Uncharacterized protein n=1 Tax=Mixia osmundae (strain CBS 9802 / IAM 14324 / JCM 22182 / KY 12970) TaxID=764103 RepID=G7DYR1_MIXOS|nr:uncharacterized protein L969DRAFT_101813 [Mixia osmundae IAM 14324]KEI41620.1 hypothetical protein L969DRAFT_101813 [Mixia osmundae IAM 14324]GAA95721.1 hypothetical protein E5Q_02378 [Mixia osmundae IAM 14324]